MAYYNQIPAGAEKMVQQPRQQGFEFEFEFPAAGETSTTLRTPLLDTKAFYRKVLMNYIYPKGHEWFIISLNAVTFVTGVLGGHYNPLDDAKVWGFKKN